MPHAGHDGGGPLAAAAVELVLFDLSGVLADFVGAHAMAEMVGCSEREVWRRWLASPWMRRFDVDACSPAEFAAGTIAEWKLTLTPDDFLARWRSWMRGPYPGAEQLVADVREHVAVGCLSNMNPTHWDEMCDWPLIQSFDRRFVSCEIALVKPDPEIFHYVTDFLALEPEQVFFMDDNKENVEAARAVGFRATHVRGLRAAHDALVACGVLSSRPPQPAGS